MRTQNKNRQKIYISNQTGMTPVYEYDEDGNLKYITVDGKTVPVTTGEYEMGYSYPVECKANIALSGGEVSNVEFGIDFSAYDAVLEGIDKIDDLKITETTLIWHKSPLVWKDRTKTIINPNSADYRVTRVSPSLNEQKFLLQKVNKNG